MKYKIDKGVPIPKQETRGRRPIYPFGKLEVGDSFAVDIELRERIQAYAAQYKRYHGGGWDYVTRSNETETRVWRTA